MAARCDGPCLVACDNDDRIVGVGFGIEDVLLAFRRLRETQRTVDFASEGALDDLGPGTEKLRRNGDADPLAQYGHQIGIEAAVVAAGIDDVDRIDEGRHGEADHRVILQPSLLDGRQPDSSARVAVIVVERMAEPPFLDALKTFARNLPETVINGGE